MNFLKTLKRENFKLFESGKSIEDFYWENHINPEELSFLGSGEFGTAYLTHDNRVLKQTSSKTEFGIAQKMEKINIPVLRSFAKIYKTEIINDSKLHANMFIIMEHLKESGKIENLWYEMDELLQNQGLSVQYLNHLDIDELEEQGYEISEELQKFMDDLDGIIRAYRYFGIEASDIQPDNLGYSNDGTLKAFDIDDKNK
jgi:hypothetical protein